MRIDEYRDHEREGSTDAIRIPDPRHPRAGPGGGGPTGVAGRGPLADIGNEAPHTGAELYRRDPPKKPEDAGGNAWHGVFSPSSFSHLSLSLSRGA